jgi:hypothetical protein
MYSTPIAGAAVVHIYSTSLLRPIKLGRAHPMPLAWTGWWRKIPFQPNWVPSKTNTSSRAAAAAGMTALLMMVLNNIPTGNLPFTLMYVYSMLFQSVNCKLHFFVVYQNSSCILNSVNHFFRDFFTSKSHATINHVDPALWEILWPAAGVKRVSCLVKSPHMSNRLAASLSKYEELCEASFLLWLAAALKCLVKWFSVLLKGGLRRSDAQPALSFIKTRGAREEEELPPASYTVHIIMAPKWSMAAM